MSEKKIPRLVTVGLSMDEIDALALFLHSFNTRPKDGYMFSEKVLTKKEVEKYELAVMALFESVTQYKIEYYD